MKYSVKLARLILIVSLLLSGCASMNNEFECPMKPGVMCKSLDQVNHMIDSGQIGRDEDKVCTTCKKTAQLNKFETPYASSVTSASKTTAPTIGGEKIWIAPYKDKEGNIHAEKNIYPKTAI